MERFDLAILGAGAAGLFCAGSVAKAGKRVIVIDHAAKPGEKIRISGGGRCNFTNLATSYDRFLSQNQRFAASALSGYSAQEFVRLVDGAGIAWHEKAQGQLFCDDSARQIIAMLLDRMRDAELRLNCAVEGLRPADTGYVVQTSRGPIHAESVVVATGGRSIPKMGATGIGYQIAQDMGLTLVEPRPGLVPLTFAEQDLNLCRPLAGIAVEAEVAHGAGRTRALFRDALLFTHRGLSGPAILQISSFWRPGNEILVNLLPTQDLAAGLKTQKQKAGRVQVNTALASFLPARLAEALVSEMGLEGARLADQPNAVLERLGARVNAWSLRPVGSEGYRTAEVTVGGLDTRELDARTMESRKYSDLYFIGEVVDVTGWLGGYNFQWAWASAEAAARAIKAKWLSP